MHKLTITFGILLILLGVVCFVATGHTHPTSLIPAGFGVLLAIFGALASSDDAKKRMLWMHIAVTVGLIGFLATIKGAYQTIQLASGTVFEHPIAVEEKGAMCLICLVFVLFCVRSFIAARRARLV